MGKNNKQHNYKPKAKGGDKSTAKTTQQQEVAIKDYSPISQKDQDILSKFVPQNTRQEESKKALVNMLDSSRMVMIQVEKTLIEYQEGDSFNPDNLLFFINIMSVRPRLQAQFIKILPQYASIELDKDATGVYVGCNTKYGNTEKKMVYQSLRENLKTLRASSISTLAQHPLIKKDVADKAKDPSKLKEKFAKLVQEMLNVNIGVTTMHRLVDEGIMPAVDVTPVSTIGDNEQHGELKTLTPDEIASHALDTALREEIQKTA